MAFTSFLTLICILNFNHFLTATNPNPNQSTLQTYIVHVDGGAKSNDLDTLYDSFLQSTNAMAAGDPPRIVHRYRNVFKGFAARLSENELESMRGMEGFVSAHPDQIYQLHTTHSPNFLGLNQNTGVWNLSNYGKGVIIGVLDSGITPDHPSFSDKGMPPPPAKWKGKCEFKGRACNNKLIGARRFGGTDELNTPDDRDGHGTHTTSTAGGNFVPGASIFGNANGTASGIAPLAHVAMYGVCNPRCHGSDILAGMDAAIEDGVDIMSLSLGLGTQSDPFYYDSIAIGAYRAMEKGIVVSCSAGNNGPIFRSLSNEAPWILTVGASTIDRKLRSTVVLGNGEELDGESAFQPRDFDSSKEFELFYPGTDENPSYCNQGDLKAKKAKGKIVICQAGVGTSVAKGVVVKNAGGAGMILMNTGLQESTTFAEAHVLPASNINNSDATKLDSYLKSTRSPKARIVFKGTIIGGDPDVPVVTFFSSRGPSVSSPGILKPDIIGPGHNILAAWNKSPSNATTADKYNFNMISGTSMACPHLSGVAALLKSVHPDWSPAAIKSAIMTTADQVNRGGKPIKSDQGFINDPSIVFAIGAGHVNPSKAADPGLIYDIHPDDYIPYLCGLNYTSEQVSLLVQRKVECSSNSSIPQAQLNYPSFSIEIKSAGNQTYTRTVTNVGEANSLYEVEIIGIPAIVPVTVTPTKLQFSKVGEKLKYSVTFTGTRGSTTQVATAAIKWRSKKHTVTSPIALQF